MSDFSRRVAAACHARGTPATQVSSAHCPPIIARIDDGKHLHWRTMSGNQCDWRTKDPGRGRGGKGRNSPREARGGRARQAPASDPAAARRREGQWLPRRPVPPPPSCPILGSRQSCSSLSARRSHTWAQKYQAYTVIFTNPHNWLVMDKHSLSTLSVHTTLGERGVGINEPRVIRMKIIYFLYFHII